MSRVTELRVVVGEGVRAIREAAELRQQDLSGAAKAIGLTTWSRTQVAAIERGAKAISAEDLLRLVAVLSSATGRTVDVAELFDNADRIPVTDTVSINAREVIEVLRGRPATWHRQNRPLIVDTPERRDAAVRAAAIRRAAGRTGLLTVGETRAVTDGLGEADERAARKLGVGGHPYQTLCAVLWGRSLSAERDARLAAAGADEGAAASRAARRGRVTRDLLTEARELLARADDNEG